jgi:hypothetical protein
MSTTEFHRAFLPDAVDAPEEAKAKEAVSERFETAIAVLFTVSAVVVVSALAVVTALI